MSDRLSILRDLLAESDARLADHTFALCCAQQAGPALALLWLSRTWIWQTVLAESSKRHLPVGVRVRVQKAMREAALHPESRAANSVAERFALPALIMRLFPEVRWNPELLSPSALFLCHTPLGAPRIGWRGPLARWGLERGVALRDLHVSFSHDGGAFAAAALWRPGARGLGVDLVHLPRLARPTDPHGYLLRLARKFMSEEERAGFLGAVQTESAAEAARRLGAHFSLMESASKALGTGLRIGGGFGLRGGLPMRSINLSQIEPDVHYSLGGEAKDRMASLGGSILEGQWSADSEYLLSIAVLSGDSAITRLRGRNRAASLETPGEDEP